MRKLITLIAALAVFMSAFAAPGLADNRRGGDNGDPTVYDIARDASKGRWAFDRNGDDFDILLVALRVTGLKGAVDDPNADLTVFAPTDKTFRDTFGGRTEFGTLLRVLRAVNYDLGALKNILLYHVTDFNTDAEKGLSFAEVAEALKAGDVTVPMVNGGSTVVKGDLTINGGSSGPSTIDATDIGLGVASNGVIHVIGGSVLLP